MPSRQIRLPSFTHRRAILLVPQLPRFQLLPPKPRHASAAAGPAPLRTLTAVAAHDKEINAVAIAPNDSLVATASQDRTIRLWTLPGLVAGLTLRGHKRGVWAVAFSPVDQVRGAGARGWPGVCGCCAAAASWLRRCGG